MKNQQRDGISEGSQSAEAWEADKRGTAWAALPMQKIQVKEESM